MNIFLFIAFIILCSFLIASLLYLRFDLFKKFFHDVMKWHKPDGTKEVFNMTIFSRCKHCHKYIMQDSQGNWYDPNEYSEKEDKI